MGKFFPKKRRLGQKVKYYEFRIGWIPLIAGIIFTLQGILFLFFAIFNPPFDLFNPSPPRPTFLFLPGLMFLILGIILEIIGVVILRKIPQHTVVYTKYYYDIFNRERSK